MTLYRLVPHGRTRASALEALAGDLALALRVEDVLVQQLPQEGCVGVFVPRTSSASEPLLWRDLFGSIASRAGSHGVVIPLLLGTDWLGVSRVDDLTTLPHLLVAGSTGSGKSVFMRSILATIVYSMNNCDCELVLSDTKGVEFTDFVGCKHLRYGEAATTPLRTVEQMDLLCNETDRRLCLIGSKGARNIKEYNKALGDQLGTKLPYIILAIDELADIVDLPSEKGKARRIGAEKLDYLTRKARAAGIHVIASTQRPSVDVVKGVIKSNFMARICFRVPSAVDSRVVLDEVGAEHLLKQGDMLYKSPNFPGLQRLHSGLATSLDISGALRYASYQQADSQNQAGQARLSQGAPNQGRIQ